MMWLYRVFHNQEGFCVRVVLYERDGTLIGYHKEPAAPNGRTAEELAQDIKWFKQAFELPILTIEEVESELAQRSLRQRQTQTRRRTLAEIEAELAIAEQAESELSIATEAVPTE